MSRKSMFTDEQIKQMKQEIRTGEPIVMLAEKLAPRYNVSENSMRIKLYSLARRTYKIAEWTGPKQRRRRIDNTLTVPTQVTGKKVVMYDDHIRIYF
jgi:hypothetical protein